MNKWTSLVLADKSVYAPNVSPMESGSLLCTQRENFRGWKTFEKRYECNAKVYVSFNESQTAAVKCEERAKRSWLFKAGREGEKQITPEKFPMLKKVLNSANLKFSKLLLSNA